jgi:hypothetical protein
MAYGGINIATGLSLRPYGAGSQSTDPFFSDVTVLYGFEDANFGSGVHNDGSGGNGTVIASGVIPSTAHFVAGAKSAAFNQTGANSNNGITLGATTSLLGSGAANFTLEGWIYDPQTAFFQLFSCGPTDDSSFRLNIDFPSNGGVNCVFGSSTTRSSAAGVWPANQFFHFAFVFDTGPAFRVYVNGTQVLSGTDAFTRSGTAYLGHHNYTAVPISGPAFLDEFRLTKVARYSGTSFTVPSVPFPRS